MFRRYGEKTPGQPYRIPLADVDFPGGGVPSATPPKITILENTDPRCLRCGSLEWDYVSDIMARCICGNFWFEVPNKEH